MITKKEFNEMSFDDAFQYCYECYERENKFYYRKGLIECAIDYIKHGNNEPAITILQALDEYPTTDCWFYLSDADDSPIPINCKNDLFLGIDFEDGPQTYTVELTGSQTVHVDVDSSMSTQDIFNKIVEQIKIKKTAENIYNIMNASTGEKMW